MTLEEQIAILQAAKEGKLVKASPTIPVGIAFAVGEGHAFDFVSYRYEIVPEPMEIWVNVYAGGLQRVYESKQAAENYLGHDGRTVKFREVLDDE